MEQQPTRLIYTGNKVISSRKQRFSKHELLRVLQGNNIEGPSTFRDGKAKWILELYKEFGITYYPSVDIVKEMQGKLQQKAENIERSCKRHETRRNEHDRRQRLLQRELDRKQRQSNYKKRSGEKGTK